MLRQCGVSHRSHWSHSLVPVQSILQLFGEKTLLSNLQEKENLAFNHIVSLHVYLLK